jgi:hypothetical protein
MFEHHAKELRTTLALWDNQTEEWALSAEEEAGLLGSTAFAGPLTHAASWGASHMEQRLRLLTDFGATLDSVLIEQQCIRIWLRSPRDSLQGLSPIQAMSSSVEWIHLLRRAALEFAA